MLRLKLENFCSSFESSSFAMSCSICCELGCEGSSGAFCSVSLRNNSLSTSDAIAIVKVILCCRLERMPRMAFNSSGLRLILQTLSPGTNLHCSSVPLKNTSIYLLCLLVLQRPIHIPRLLVTRQCKHFCFIQLLKGYSKSSLQLNNRPAITLAILKNLSKVSPPGT